MSLFEYLSDPANWTGQGGIWYLLLQHLGYTVAAVGIAAVIAIPVGIFIGHTNRGSFLVIGLSNAAALFQLWVFWSWSCFFWAQEWDRSSVSWPCSRIGPDRNSGWYPRRRS